MNVISLDSVKKTRDAQVKRQNEEALEFTYSAWQIAVEHSRFLPRDMALKLIQQIVYDHGVRIDELKKIL